MELLKSVFATLILGGFLLGAGVVAHITYNIVIFGWSIIG